MSQNTYKKILMSNSLINGGLALLITVPIAPLAPYIMRSYGPGFEEGIIALIILTLSTILISSSEMQ